MEMLDLEQDEMLCDHIREAVSAILGAVGAENPRKWLSLCKGVLSLAANSDGVSKQTDMVGLMGLPWNTLYFGFQTPKQCFNTSPNLWLKSRISILF